MQAPRGLARPAASGFLWLLELLQATGLDEVVSASQGGDMKGESQASDPSRGRGR